MHLISFSLVSDRHWMKRCSFSRRNEERIIGEREDIDRYTFIILLFRQCDSFHFCLLRVLSSVLWLLFLTIQHLCPGIDEVENNRYTRNWKTRTKDFPQVFQGSCFRTIKGWASCLERRFASLSFYWCRYIWKFIYHLLFTKN